MKTTITSLKMVNVYYVIFQIVQIVKTLILVRCVIKLTIIFSIMINA